MKIILASASPRRKELLGYITKDFEVIVSNADESFAEYEPRSFSSIDCVKPVTPVVVSKLELSRKFSFPPPATDDAVLLPPSFSGKEYIVTS